MPPQSLRPHGEAVEDALRHPTLRRPNGPLASAAEPPSTWELSAFSSFLQNANAPIEEIHIRDAEVFNGRVVGSELGQEISTLVVVRAQT